MYSSHKAGGGVWHRVALIVGSSWSQERQGCELLSCWRLPLAPTVSQWCLSYTYIVPLVHMTVSHSASRSDTRIPQHSLTLTTRLPMHSQLIISVTVWCRGSFDSAAASLDCCQSPIFLTLDCCQSPITIFPPLTSSLQRLPLIAIQASCCVIMNIEFEPQEKEEAGQTDSSVE